MSWVDILNEILLCFSGKCTALNIGNCLLQRQEFDELNLFGVRPRVPFPLLRQVGYSWLPLTSQLNHLNRQLTQELLQQCQRASRMVVKGKKTKNPPVLSHEFVIQNHADIVACVAMVFVVGLMFQISSPAASVFIALHHNVSVPTEIQPGVFQDVLAYTQGPKDIPAIFFYLLISVVMHAIIQEYLLDKVNKKLHLSKIKHAKFNESGQLLAFYITSIVWAGDIVLRYEICQLFLAS